MDRKLKKYLEEYTVPPYDEMKQKRTFLLAEQQKARSRGGRMSGWKFFFDQIRFIRKRTVGSLSAGTAGIADDGKKSAPACPACPTDRIRRGGSATAFHCGDPIFCIRQRRNLADPFIWNGTVFCYVCRMHGDPEAMG